jgi:hypothetical protein
MTEVLITFYEFLVLVVGMFLCGWAGRISYMQFKADKQREQEAEARRQAYIRQKRWDANMKESEMLGKEYIAMGGVEK